jgi:multiple sugar transport system substrate-binding protein
MRKATGRDDVYGVGLAMSVSDDTSVELEQFIQVYQANYVTRDGKLVIDDPDIRRRLIRAMDAYTAVYHKGCTPPEAVGWNNRGNNEAFLAAAIVMTPSFMLTIPNALKPERPEEYYKNTATMAWPDGVDGHPLAIHTDSFAATVFEAGAVCLWPRSSCAFWWGTAGSRTISTSPANVCCRRCRSCSTSRSGSIRATGITWPRRSSS